MCSFVRSFVSSLVCLFAPSFVSSFVRSLICSLVRCCFGFLCNAMHVYDLLGFVVPCCVLQILLMLCYALLCLTKLRYALLPLVLLTIRSWIFIIFGSRQQNQRKWPSEAGFSAFSATGARTSENDHQKLDFLHFQPQAPEWAKMTIRSWIFSICTHRRQNQWKWSSEAGFSAFPRKNARITEN